MRLRVLLPILQTIAMLLIVWAPWNPRAQQIDIVLRDGREIKGWTLISAVQTAEWAMGINLPALTVATPVEFAIRKPDALPNYKVQFFGLWLVGFLCWYMVGRFADDLISWRRNSALPRKHWADLTFALIAFPSAILLAGPFTVDRVGPTSLAVWGVFWLVITTCVLVLRIVQVIKQRRTTAAL
jgi:predicted permease